MIIVFRKILTSYSHDLVVVFLGEHKSLLHLEYQFKLLDNLLIDDIVKNANCFKSYESEVGIVEIREHTELDNFFFCLSNQDIARINITDNFGVIRQNLTIHQKRESYYESVLEWYQESQAIFL